MMFFYFLCLVISISIASGVVERYRINTATLRSVVPNLWLYEPGDYIVAAKTGSTHLHDEHRYIGCIDEKTMLVSKPGSNCVNGTYMLTQTYHASKIYKLASFRNITLNERRIREANIRNQRMVATSRYNETLIALREMSNDKDTDEAALDKIIASLSDGIEGAKVQRNRVR